MNPGRWEMRDDGSLEDGEALGVQDEGFLPVILGEHLGGARVGVQEDVDGSYGLVSVDREVQAVHVRE